jgi:hypothetical protein
MRKVAFAVLFVSVLVLTAVSMGYAQAAEEMAKSVAGGTRFVLKHC